MSRREDVQANPWERGLCLRHNTPWPSSGHEGVPCGRAVLRLQHKFPVLWHPDCLQFSG